MYIFHTKLIPYSLRSLCWFIHPSSPLYLPSCYLQLKILLWQDNYSLQTCVFTLINNSNSSLSACVKDAITDGSVNCSTGRVYSRKIYRKVVCILSTARWRDEWLRFTATVVIFLVAGNMEYNRSLISLWSRYNIIPNTENICVQWYFNGHVAFPITFIGQ